MNINSKMQAVLNELRQYQETMRLSDVGDLNREIVEGKISPIVLVSEILQEKQIARIADDITRRFEAGTRVVLIAGPSSSGKTTFCKRLQLEFLANALYPVGISLDDYYVNREDTPKDENGELDYESLYAIDLETFNNDLQRLLKGESVSLPSYDFQSGERVYKGNTVQLGERSVLIMEGIHGMNPELIPHIPAESVYRIYVSVLTEIPLDKQDTVPTTDIRMIRRLVRDYNYRGSSAKNTIDRWPSVRKGEEKWIYPYKDNADTLFNSAMIYELAALRKLAEPILEEVPEGDEAYPEACRLLKFLRYFHPIGLEDLPNTSLLREFAGGSAFKY